jgi:FkbH-like protein
VVFIDDSPMEIAEVQAAYPEMECVLFPKDDPAELYRLLYRLRDLFGKPRISKEDALRLDSIRAGAALRDAEQHGAASAEDFLRQADGSISFEFDSAGPRVLELVNKTNQFNLNGVRYSEAEWAEGLRQPGAFVLAVDYRDKFGSLGTIAVMRGRCLAGSRVQVDTWVMSCRAFSRRIEHACLKQIIDRFAARELTFHYVPTPRNGPMTEFLSGIAENLADTPVTVASESFARNCPPLYQSVKTKEDTALPSA